MLIHYPARYDLHMAPVIKFQPRWKEELVCTSQASAFVLEMPMGVVSVYYPTEAAWTDRAPKWAAPFWDEIQQQLRAWCVAQNIPLYIDDRAQVWEEAG